MAPTVAVGQQEVSVLSWTDASFKPYGMPLRAPFPVAIAAGTTIEQAVTLTLRGPQLGASGAAAVSRHAEPSSLDVAIGTRPRGHCHGPGWGCRVATRHFGGRISPAYARRGTPTRGSTSRSPPVTSSTHRAAAEGVPYALLMRSARARLSPPDPTILRGGADRGRPLGVVGAPRPGEKLAPVA